MNRSLSLIAAIAALGLMGSAQALEPEDQAGAAQPASGAQPSTIPSTEPGMPSTVGRQADPSSPQSDPPTSTQSSVSSAAQNTRLAAIVPAGMSAQEACSGFRSTDECAATLHASFADMPAGTMAARRGFCAAEDTLDCVDVGGSLCGLDGSAWWPMVDGIPGSADGIVEGCTPDAGCAAPA